MNRQNRIILSLILLIVSAGIINAQTGPLPADLDARFGSSGTGIVTTSNSSASGQVLTNANDTIFVNRYKDVLILKPNGAGIADRHCPFYYCGAMALQQNGDLLYAGMNSNGEFGVARFDGQLNLDQSFGNRGIALFNFGNPINSPSDIMEQNGKILITGQTGANNTATSQFVMRLENNGKLDTSFGANGVVTESSIYAGTSIAMQKDYIVVGGFTHPTSPQSATIVVYDRNGNRSPRFNNGQIFTMPGTGPSVRVDSQYRILFTGVKSAPTTGALSGIVRLTPDGQFDGSFGNNGISWFPIPDADINLSLDMRGRIVVAGGWYDIPNSTNGIVNRPVIARYDNAGRIDSSFKYSVPLIFNFPPEVRIFENKSPTTFGGIAFQSTGKILVGESNLTTSPQSQLYRFNGN